MQKVLIKDIINHIENLYPLSWQENYDNSGLILGDIEKECKGVYVSLDVSLEGIEEAIKHNCNLIISHHPIIFKGLKKIDSNSKLGKIIVEAIKRDIALYAIHTNIDNAFDGVNGILSEKIGLKQIKPLSKFSGISDKNWLGAGCIGELENEIRREDFFNHLKKVLSLKIIRYNSMDTKLIKKVALCGGSGSFLIPNAIEKEADIFLTSDIKYHDFLEHDNKILLADIGHFEGEQFIKEKIIAILSEKFCNFALLIADASLNRVKFY